MSAYRELESRFRRMAALGEAAGMLHWDMSVLMPSGGVEARTEQLTALKLTTHEMKTDPALADLLDAAGGEALRRAVAGCQPRRDASHLGTCECGGCRPG